LGEFSPVSAKAVVVFVAAAKITESCTIFDKWLKPAAFALKTFEKDQNHPPICQPFIPKPVADFAKSCSFVRYEKITHTATFCAHGRLTGFCAETQTG
jgi:hypothetical protein